MRLFTFITMTMAAFLLATTASAIEVSFVGGNSATVAPGEAFTLNIALDNASASLVQGVDIELTGLAAAGATVVSGETARNVDFLGSASPVHFARLACSTSPPECSTGLASVDNAFFDPADLSGGIYSPGDDSVFIIRALASAITNGNGSLDPGLNLSFSGAGAVDASLMVTALTAGTFELTVGGTYSDGSNVLGIQQGATFTLNVIPEPGTALLMGLGLAGLAAAGRRS